MNDGTQDKRARIRLCTNGQALRHIPVGDLILQTELRVAIEKDVRAFRCPCRDCHGGRRKTIEVIRRHHDAVGRDPCLKKSMIGGDPPDGYPNQGIWVEDCAYDNDIVEENGEDVVDDSQDNPLGNGCETERGDEPILDEHHEVHRQVMEAFDRSDALHVEALDEVAVVDNDDDDSDTMDGLEELYEQATTPLYAGAKCSVVSATIIIMNMCTVFRVSNRFIDELLQYLSKDLLPQPNNLPSTHYIARRSIRKLGLTYNNVHACPDGCVLFEEEHATLESCPKCDKSRWIPGSKAIPAKVIRHFPLIPRLKRMWRSVEIAHMLTGYKKHRSVDGIMRSVIDSPAWKHIDNNAAFGNFGAEDRNLRFALTLDGVNPFKLSNTNWSTWPVLILIYNFEPWFVTKKFFISLCILISGKHSPTSKNLDVFLRPLMRELHELWEGVRALDFSRPEGSRGFILRGLVMWTISDFPTYGLISGLCCKGYRGCPPCGPETDAGMAGTGDVLPSQRIKGRKILYNGARRYLPRHHPYRQNKRFNGEVELRSAPPVVSAVDVIHYAAWRQSYLDLGGKENAKDDPVHWTGVKRLCSLYELPYWQYLLIRHLLDVMHCEKNICENIVKTLMAMNDSPGSRMDVQNLGIREELWLQPSERRNADYYMPHAPYVLDVDARKEFVGIISSIRTPTNYVGSIHKRLVDGKLHYMKTHDYHVLMQQVLPVAVRGVLDENVRSAIIKMCRVFQRICAKEIRSCDEEDMMKDVVLATCMFEKEFPPTFMNVMSHLPLHLVQQLFICGPVHCRWMYPIERYMKTLKDYVRTYAHPEGSIAEGYRMEDTLGFCTEFMKQYKGTSQRVWDATEDAIMNDEVLSSHESRKRKMSQEMRAYAHAFVLDNAARLQPWREEYVEAKTKRWEDREAFRLQSRRRHVGGAMRYPLELSELPSFADWFRVRVSEVEHHGSHVEPDILQYTEPPERYATSHRQMYCFGVHFRVRSSEAALVTRDSCVVASFTRELGWGIQDGRLAERTDDYVGYIEEILELDYRNHYTTVLVCDWVRASHDARSPNIIRDKYGFTIANFNHMDGKVHADSFAFPLHCQQVFYSDDPHRRGWKVVCKTDVRGRRSEPLFATTVSNVLEVGNDVDFIGLQPPMLPTEPTRFAETNGGTYIRTFEQRTSPCEETSSQ